MSDIVGSSYFKIKHLANLILHTIIKKNAIKNNCNIVSISMTFFQYYISVKKSGFIETYLFLLL